MNQYMKAHKKHETDIFGVFVCGDFGYDKQICIAAFQNIVDAAKFVQICGVRCTIEPYAPNSLMVRDITVIERIPFAY